MKSNELIQGKWYTCKQWNDNNLMFKFEKEVKDSICGYFFYRGNTCVPRKKYFIPYYYYGFIEIEMPSEAVKPTPKRKRYEKKKVEGLLEELAGRIYYSISTSTEFDLDKFKQDNL